MINAIFNACVWLLVWAAQHLGITYEAINVWVFVIIWPVVTLALFAVIFVQQCQIRRLRRLPCTSK